VGGWHFVSSSFFLPQLVSHVNGVFMVAFLKSINVIMKLNENVPFLNSSIMQ